MNDTQWPRFQVFVQEDTGSPHMDFGSIHAPDAELALFNARDVFARRPECVSMWIVPVSAIYSVTLEVIMSDDALDSPKEVSTAEPYAVFCKRRPAGTQTFVGQVNAGSPQEALRLALDQFDSGRTMYAWWIFPTRQIIRSKEEDIPSLFAPAHGKSFRMAVDFHTVSAMRTIRNTPAKDQTG